MANIEIVTADILEWAKSYTGPKFHGMLCDPPYHLTSGKNANGGFMGKKWDGGEIAFNPDTWAALKQHLLPGAHILAFGGTRGFHRLVCAIEDAGFECKDILCYAYGQGFPKSRNIWKTDIQKEIENQLRKQGYIGEIKWKK
jgi:site-specific DNA-methyltransferase (adenine-specific)